MRLSSVCFVYAGLCATFGMIIGIWMGVSGDHTLGPAHAHLNVVGWLSMAVFGAYHRGTGRTESRLDRIQVGTMAIGVPAFVGGLAIYMTTTRKAAADFIFPVGLVGTFLCLGAMILFVIIAMRDGLGKAPPPV